MFIWPKGIIWTSLYGYFFSTIFSSWPVFCRVGGKVKSTRLTGQAFQLNPWPSVNPLATCAVPILPLFDLCRARKSFSIFISTGNFFGCEIDLSSVRDLILQLGYFPSAISVEMQGHSIVWCFINDTFFVPRTNWLHYEFFAGGKHCFHVSSPLYFNDFCTLRGCKISCCVYQTFWIDFHGIKFFCHIYRNIWWKKWYLC